MNAAPIITLVNTDSGEAWSAIYVDGVRDGSYGYGEFEDPAAVLRALGLVFETKFYSGDDELPLMLIDIDEADLDDEGLDGVDHLYSRRRSLIDAS